MMYLKIIIEEHPETTFWAATKDFSKKYVLTASKLGIKNIVQFPIRENLITSFFDRNIEKEELSAKFKNDYPLSNSHILIVDDNELNIELLEEILSNPGIKITSVTNPVSAKKLIKTTHFNLFLLDILMPEMSGFELAGVIKESELNKNVPIIFISALNGDENIMNGYSCGACSYIEKPFSPSIVKAQIYNVLRQEEENKKTEKFREDFVATLTHDLKGPINAEICALKQLIEKDGSFFNKREILSELLNSAQYMKIITDKIMCYYKQKHDKLQLNKEYTNIYPFVMSCIDEMKFLCEEKNISIRLFNNTGDLNLSIDKIEIKRVINNLITNAVEYSDKNSFTDITLDKDDKFFIFAIRDYGAGIDLDKHYSVFDEYMSLSKEHKKTGFGLGLNICKKITEAHGGDISIESKPSEGTKITFKLPL